MLVEIFYLMLLNNARSFTLAILQNEVYAYDCSVVADEYIVQFTDYFDESLRFHILQDALQSMPDFAW